MKSLYSYYKHKPFTSFLLFLLPIVAWSIISPKHLTTWFAEALPVFVGVAILIKSHKSFPLTSFSYLFIYAGCVLVLIGAHYTYSHVPLFDWIKNSFGLERNNYDKLGHFFQGFITAIITKEVLTRKRLMNSKPWINTFSIVFSLSLSAAWEISEWLGVTILVYLGSQKSAGEFLGAQNYYWDAQSDMLFAFIGALSAIVLFGKYHEKKSLNSFNLHHTRTIKKKVWSRYPTHNSSV